MKKIRITTEDGSPSFYSEQFNEIYHSKKDAITESDYVYINKGLGGLPLSQRNQIQPTS